MSKFDFEWFYGDYSCLGVSKEKYTQEEALKIAIVELADVGDGGFIAIKDAFARHRAGVDEDGERYVGWWLEYFDAGRNCPIWCFRYVFAKELERDKEVEDGWEYIAQSEA